MSRRLQFTFPEGAIFISCLDEKLLQNSYPGVEDKETKEFSARPQLLFIFNPQSDSLSHRYL